MLQKKFKHSMDDDVSIVPTPEQRLDVYEKILLGRKITRIELSRDRYNKLTGWIIFSLEDGGEFRIEDSNDKIMLTPPSDIKKVLQGIDDWRLAMPDESFKLIEEVKNGSR